MIKKHIPFMIILLLISMTVLYKNLDLYSMPKNRDQTESIKGTDITSFFAIIDNYLKDSITKRHDLIPLWNPYYLAGTPFFFKPQIAIFSLLTPLLLIAPTSWAAVKWSHILYLFLAGLSMYILMIYLKKGRKAAFISALVYMLNGYIIRETMVGHSNISYGYAWLPLIVLFTFKAFKDRNFIPSSTIAGIFMASIIHSGGPQLVLYTGLMLAALFIFKILEKASLNRVLKAAMIGAIVIIVFFGLSAIRILPTSEIMKIGQRQEPYEYDYLIKGALKIKDAAKFIIEPGWPKLDIQKSYSYQIGLIPFILLCFGFLGYKKKTNIIFIGLLTLALLLFFGSPLYYFIYKFVPYFNTIKGILKGFAIFMLPASVLAGVGFSILMSKIKFSKKNLLFIGISLLILVDLAVFGEKLGPHTNFQEEINNNHILQHISKQEGLFRIKSYEAMGLDWSAGHYAMPLEIPILYGYDATYWIPDYIPLYMSVGNRQPAKLFGILNMKYMTANEPINVSGFKFLKRFDECEECRPFFADGPYLYENERFLPRAYIVPNSILIVGDDEQVVQTMYGLMLDDNYDPSNTVIIKGKNIIDEYTTEELKRFTAIFLTQGSISSNSINKLRSFVDSGGILLPDITKNENQLSEEKMTEMWDSLKGDIAIIEDSRISFDTFDKMIIDIKQKQSGFLVLSEKYSMFPGWHADINKNKKEILRADGVISAVYLENESGKLVFEYAPKSYIIGKWITIFTLLLIIVYFSYLLLKKKKIVKVSQENKNEQAS